jgi:chemotaxis signal transduction protein
MSALAKQINPFNLISSLERDYSDKKLILKEVNKGQIGISVVQVVVADMVFAVEVGLAVETIRYKKPQQLPRSYPWGLGVIEVRGEVIPVFDLAVFNEQPAVKIDRDCRLMIIRHEELAFASVISSVSTVSTVPEIYENADKEELGEFSWQKTNTNQWIEIHGKKLHFLDVKSLLNCADFLTLTR